MAWPTDRDRSNFYLPFSDNFSSSLTFIVLNLGLSYAIYESVINELDQTIRRSKVDWISIHCSWISKL